MTWWLGRLTALVIGLALFMVGVLLFGEDAAGRIVLRQYVTELDQRLRFLRSSIRGSNVLAVQVSIALGCTILAVVAGQWLLLVLIPPVAVGPKVFIDRQAARRVAKVEEQIEPWINAVANALKASASLGEAIASSIPLIQAPMTEEVDVLIKEYELGTPLDRALENLAQRIGSKTLSGTVLALQVARKSGGNLPEMLQNAAAALRELARLEGVVRSKTAEGKAQAFVIGLIPVPMVLGIHALDPRFFEPLSGSFLGNLIIAGAAVLWILAIIAARKILAVDV